MSKGNSLIILLVLLLLLYISFCAPSKKIEIPPQQLAEYNNKIKEADALYKKGSYSSLKQAFKIYQDQLAFPAFQRKTRVRLLKSALLLGLRENELQILGDKYLIEASHLIENYPDLSRYLNYYKIVQITSETTKGYARRSLDDSSSIKNYFEWAKKNVDPLNAELKEKAELEDFFAYLYITFCSDFSYYIKERDDFSLFLKIFPDSHLMQFTLALYPVVSQKSLEELVQEEPSFHEAHYFLGEVYLRLGKIISAEKNYLKAYEQIPESLSIIMSFTKIYFAHEEFEKCLEFNEKALGFASEYRDALLGKAICLSYLGRSEEAIEVLNKLLELGRLLMGETHYWLAWNHNELKKYEEAWEYIEATKKYLIGHHEVHSLAGIIAYEMENLEEAEKNFKQALEFNSSNCEAAFYLGKLYSQKESWKDSGIYFEKAAVCNERMENALTKKIADIKDSSFSEERKKKHIARKRLQLQKTQLTKATSFYNAAAGYFNAGIKEKALGLAQKAASHSMMKEKADELVERIKMLEKFKTGFPRVPIRKG